MSVNLFLDESIRKAPGFGFTTKNGWNQPIFGDFELWGGEKGQRLYARQNIDEAIPAVLEEFVTEVSFHELFTATEAKRELGIYRDDGLEAEVDITPLGARDIRYSVKISGGKDDIKKIVRLYRKIRAGTILPAESWSADQIRTQESKEPKDTATVSQLDSGVLPGERNEAYAL